MFGFLNVICAIHFNIEFFGTVTSSFFQKRSQESPGLKAEEMKQARSGRDCDLK